MARVWKDIIRPGTYQAPQGRLVVTASRCRRWVKLFDQMRKLGIQIPVCWGHQPGAIPGEGADKSTRQFLMSKLNAGYLEGMRINPQTGGIAGLVDVPGAETDDDGNLITEAELPDGRKVKSAIKEVSAAIRDWKDGSGREWPDAIIHLALVTLPVMAGQAGFSAAKGTEGRPGEWHLSLSDLLYTLATEGNPMPGEYATDNAGGGYDGTNSGRTSRTLSVLKSFGLHLPPDTNEGNLCERIDLCGGAILADRASRGGMGGEDDMDDLEASDLPVQEPDTGPDSNFPEEGMDDFQDDPMGNGEGEMDSEEGNGEDVDQDMLDDGFEDTDNMPPEEGDNDDLGDGETEEGLEDQAVDDGDGETISGDSDAMPGEDEEEEDDEDAEEEPRPVMMGTGRGKGQQTLRTPLERSMARQLASHIKRDRLARLKRLRLPKHQHAKLAEKIERAPCRLQQKGKKLVPVQERVDIELSTIEGLHASGTLKTPPGKVRRMKRPDQGPRLHDGEGLENDKGFQKYIDEQAANHSQRRGK